MHSHGSKGHVVERNIRKSESTVLWYWQPRGIATVSFGIMAQPKKVYVVASSSPVNTLEASELGTRYRGGLQKHQKDQCFGQSA
jgi:hypothetical protein